MSVKLYYATSQTLFARELRDDSGTLVSGAAVSVSLRNRYSGDVVPAQFLTNVSMTEVPGTPGTYSCAIPNTFAPAPGRVYEVVFTVSKGGSTVAIEKAAEVLHLVTQ